MCGRFTLRTPADLVAEVFELLRMPELTPRYNIAPTQQVATVVQTEAGRELQWKKWGLVPSWADDPSIGNRMINARADTVASKPSYRSAFKSRRCLIVADGFYEWSTIGKLKQPHLIHMQDDRPFAIAGLYEHWQKDGQEIDSCTLITTDANEVLAPFHDRMPVIIPPQDYGAWLTDLKRAPELLRPFPPDAMEEFPVSTIVNNARNESAECVVRLK